MIAAAYSAKDRKRWDTFVRNSRNGTLLFDRAYMEYHAERFVDASLIIDEADAALALLPASRHDNTIRSHGGLTYGGFITDGRMRVEKMLRTFDAALAFYASSGITRLEYKAIPHIYHRAPAEEDAYALFRLGAQLLKREPSAALHLLDTGLPGKKRNGAARAAQLGLRFEQVSTADALMALINTNLQLRHGVSAVHSAAEMNRLRAAFPRSIEIFHVCDGDGRLVGGAIVYVAGPVAHTQYLVASEAGRASRAMDFLIHALATRYREGCQWLEFGISTEAGGQVLNEGLMSQKEEFGARCVCYDTYVIDL